VFGKQRVTERGPGKWLPGLPENVLVDESLPLPVKLK